MRVSRTLLALVPLIAITTMGEQCFTFNDDGVIAVNVDDVSGTYNITTGALQFANPNRCVTKFPSDYLDQDFNSLKGARVVDVTVQTIGTFSGTVSGGSISINNTQLVSYSGAWSTFNTQQSLLTSTALTRNQAGVNAFIAAVTANPQQPVIVCVDGTFSSAAPAGLSVKVTVFAQIDIIP
jgi:hypothetical protein